MPNDQFIPRRFITELPVYEKIAYDVDGVNTLRKIIHEPLFAEDARLRHSVAYNKYLTDELLWEGFKDETHPKIVHILKRHRLSEKLIHSIITNPKVSSDTILLLAGEPNISMKLAEEFLNKNVNVLTAEVLRNPNLTLELFEKATQNPTREILSAVVGTNYTFGPLPTRIIDLVMRKPQSHTAFILAKHGNQWSEKDLGRYLQNLNNYSSTLRSSFAVNPFVPPDILISMLNDPNREVLNALSRNKALPYEAQLHIISNHKTPQLRIEIAYNTKYVDILEIIYCNTKSVAIRDAVKTNPLFPELEKKL